MVQRLQDGERMTEESEVRGLVAMLSDPYCVEDPRRFPRDPVAANSAGLYSWWADSVARDVFCKAGLDLNALRAGENEFALIYIGQAGATKWPSGRTSTASLRSRIKSNHIGGNIKSSTFRETIAAVLVAASYCAVVAPRKLSRNDNHELSDWIKDHCRVNAVPFGDRDSLGRIEDAVLQEIDPPCNIENRHTNDFRERLDELRKALRAG